MYKVIIKDTDGDIVYSREYEKFADYTTSRVEITKLLKNVGVNPELDDVEEIIDSSICTYTVDLVKPVPEQSKDPGEVWLLEENYMYGDKTTTVCSSFESAVKNISFDKLKANSLNMRILSIDDSLQDYEASIYKLKVQE